MFVTIEEGHVQLFSNRFLSDKYIADEIKQIKEYAYKVTKESVPYADVIIGVVESNNDVNKRAD